jgi:hypothetical protein
MRPASAASTAGLPVNLFQVNPGLDFGFANVEVNGGNSNYNGLQVELKRRLSKGLLFQGSYVWSHSITNESARWNQRQLYDVARHGLRQTGSPYDIRQALK